VIYFDHNATTPLIAEARQAWLDACETYPGNPSSPHRLGARADKALEDARVRLAALLGCDALDLVWTSGATESNNTVLNHVARVAPGQPVWISAIEHPCVLESARFQFQNQLQFIPTTRDGVIDLDWLSNRLPKSRPALVAVMAANNETGVLQPWRDILSLCQSREVPFLCDAAQWIGKLPAQGLGQAGFVSACAHKFGGPKGIGFLKCPSQARFHPLLMGGHQEEGRRAGTENVPGVLAMLAALETRAKRLGSATDAEARTPPDHPVALRLKWRSEFEQGLLNSVLGSQVIGSGQERLWNTVALLMPKADGQQRWVVKLDKLGYAVSTGSACASGREAPSHVLSAMGFKPDQASRMLRLSSGWETSESEWHSLLGAILEAHRLMRPTPH
jgi:cysteine desulfurase